LVIKSHDGPAFADQASGFGYAIVFPALFHNSGAMSLPRVNHSMPVCRAHPPAFKHRLPPYLDLHSSYEQKFFIFQKFFPNFLLSRLPAGGSCGGNHGRRGASAAMRCKYDYHALKRAKALLNKVSVIEFWARF